MIKANHNTVGLAGRTIYERQRNNKIRNTLMAKGLLLAMRRPTLAEGSPAYVYLHRAYARAAFQDEARDLIGKVIASHYNRIAARTLELPQVHWLPFVRM